MRFEGGTASRLLTGGFIASALVCGVSLSNVYRGLASGFLQTQNIDPTVGLLLKF